MKTTSRRSRNLVLAALVATFGLLVAACGGSSDATAPTQAQDSAAVDGTAPLEGEFLVSGSSTVYPIVLRQAEAFGGVNTGVAISVEGPGSGDGAQKFCAGEVPIANASRLYKDAEVETCQANGVEFIELRRGIDGISVVTSPDNDQIECVSLNDIYSIVSEEAFGFESWADANALTATWDGTEFADTALDIFGPGEESGTFDSFGEIVIESVAKGKTGLDPESREFVKTIRPDYTSSPDDNIIIEGVGSSQYSFGWVGYAYAQSAADAGDVKLVAVSKEDGGDCVTPNPETIASAEFPISRFLYTYVNAEAAANDPAVSAFVDYMMSDEGLTAVTAAGYVDLSAADQTLSQGIWANRSTGRSWG